MNRRRLQSLVLLLAGTAVVALFHFQGNASNVAMESRSIFLWLVYQWTAAGSDFSHGWIMPLISLAIVWHRRGAIAEAPKSVSRAGLLWTAVFLVVHIAAYRAQQPRISTIAFVGLTWSLPLYLYGPGVARQLVFPCAYLLLCVTSYLLVNFTFQLRMAAGVVATVLLNGLGIAAQRSGTAIYSAAGGGFAFDVADPCSGLRSLMVLTALAAPIALWTQKTRFKQWVLFTSSIPLAMVANIVRIVTIAIVAEAFGQETALRIYHDFSGHLVFVVAVMLLMTVSALLNTPLGDRLKACKKRATTPA